MDVYGYFVRKGIEVAAVAVISPEKRNMRLGSTFPCGRRSPKGRSRWYLVEAPEGREDETCERVRKIVPPSVLQDAFCIRKEHWMKRGGRWSVVESLMYKGYFIAVSSDVVGLNRALSALSFPARLMGANNKAYMPIADDVRDWFVCAMDARHVVKSSTAVINDGVLSVQEGPLVGQEDRLSRVDRHKRRCLVRISDVDGGFVECMPLDIPVKN